MTEEYAFIAGEFALEHLADTSMTLADLNVMNGAFFSEARSCYCGFLHSDLRVHFNPVQLTVCGTILCVEKKKTRYAILSCPSAIAFFVDVLVCNSSPTSQVLRGSTPFNYRFQIILYLTRVSLDCNIKCMHSTFSIVNILLASSHPVLSQSDTNAFISSFNYYTSCSRSSSSYQCSIHQAHTRPCLRRSVKYIVLGSHFFLTPFILALVPIVQQIQDDLFDGGECGDDVLIFLSETTLRC